MPTVSHPKEIVIPFILAELIDVLCIVCDEDLAPINLAEWQNPKNTVQITQLYNNIKAASDGFNYEIGALLSGIEFAGDELTKEANKGLHILFDCWNVVCILITSLAKLIK